MTDCLTPYRTGGMLPALPRTPGVALTPALPLTHKALNLTLTLPLTLSLTLTLTLTWILTLTPTPTLTLTLGV